LVVALLAAAALALGACGGDDEGSGTTGAGSPEFTTNSGTGTTGTTEKERTETGEDRTTKTKERGNDRGGSSGSGGGSGSKNGGAGGNDDSGSTAQPPVPGNVFEIAQKVCTSFLPKVIQRDLEKEDRKPEDVARDYSRGFPGKQQKRAYEGCLAGLKAR
jgi:hypothetical protein